MKPNTIQNTGSFNNQQIRKSRIISTKNSDSTPLNELIIIYTDDGYAEIIMPSELTADLISGLSELPCQNLDDLAMLINSSQPLGKSDSPFKNTERIYVFYSRFSDNAKENINDAGYIPEFTGTEDGFYVKH